MEIKDWIQQSIDSKNLLLSPNIIHDIKVAIDLCLNALKNGNSIYLCGNGGSAADSQHIAAELTVRYKKNRPSLPGIALGTNFSQLTATANDFGYEHVFSRELDALGKKADVLIALSTSGNSPNVINAIEMAKSRNIIAIGWTGKDGGNMANLCDHIIKVPSTEVPRIQECHLLIGHILCEYIDDAY